MWGDTGAESSTRVKEFEECVNLWRNKPMDDVPRTNLDETDRFWKYAYDNGFGARMSKGELLYRVHYGIKPEMRYYSDWKECGYSSQEEPFNEAQRVYKFQIDPSNIQFDRHWVSFTKKPEALTKPYFAQKGLRGLVIITTAKENVDISTIHTTTGNSKEFEVVAPLDKAQVVEILPFNKFEEKYCKSKSEG